MQPFLLRIKIIEDGLRTQLHTFRATVLVEVFVNDFGGLAGFEDCLQRTVLTMQVTGFIGMMGNFIASFTIDNGILFNGKVIPVAVNNPN